MLTSTSPVVDESSRGQRSGGGHGMAYGALGAAAGLAVGAGAIVTSLEAMDLEYGLPTCCTVAEYVPTGAVTKPVELMFVGATAGVNV